MSLYHDFLLLAHAEHPTSNYMQFINDPRSVRMHDDLIGYFWDTLSWIPSCSPANREPTRGLCRWGPTIVLSEGAATARRIFAAWADLLDVGPPVLHLSGDWTSIEGAPWHEGEYDRLEFDREETVSRLRLLAEYADQVAASGDVYYILHIGI